MKNIVKTFSGAAKELINTLYLAGSAAIIATGVGYGLAFGFALFKFVGG